MTASGSNSLSFSRLSFSFTVIAEFLSEASHCWSYEPVTPLKSVRIWLSVQFTKLAAFGIDDATLYVSFLVSSQQLLENQSNDVSRINRWLNCIKNWFKINLDRELYKRVTAKRKINFIHSKKLESFRDKFYYLFLNTTYQFFFKMISTDTLKIPNKTIFTVSGIVLLITETANKENHWHNTRENIIALYIPRILHCDKNRWKLKKGTHYYSLLNIYK